MASNSFAKEGKESLCGVKIDLSGFAEAGRLVVQANFQHRISNYKAVTQETSVLTDWVTDPWAAPGQMLDWDAFFNYATQSSQTDNAGDEALNAEELQAWTSDFFDDAFNNWVGWGSQPYEGAGI